MEVRSTSAGRRNAGPADEERSRKHEKTEKHATANAGREYMFQRASKPAVSEAK